MLDTPVCPEIEAIKMENAADVVRIQSRGPKIPVPMRTMVAPSSIATR